MTVLVLGGAGYIGSHMVRELIETGRDVAVVDNLQTGFREAVHPNARLYEVDIRDKHDLNAVFTAERVEAVIHFAASSQVGESMVDPFAYYENNVSGTLVVLQAMQQAHVNKIIFSSTAATYGEPERVPIRELDRTQPTNCYGETKLAMERMLHWADVAHGIRSVALRYFNAAGAHHSGEIGEAHGSETHLIPLILQVALGKREHICVFGEDYPTPDGTCIRDYVHVSDLVNAHALALEHLLAGGRSEVFNLGSGEGISVQRILEVARRVTGHAIPVLSAPRRLGDPARLVANSDQIKSKLGWAPQYDSVEQIVSSAWQWHQSHPNGYGA